MDLFLNTLKANWCFPLRIQKHEIKSDLDIFEIFNKLTNSIHLQENAILGKTYYGKSTIELRNL